MRRWLLTCLVLGCGLLLNLVPEMRTIRETQAAQRPAPQARTARSGDDDPSPQLPALSFAKLVSGKSKIVDLTWGINEKSAFWPGDGYAPFELHTIATLAEDGVLSKTFSSPEHLGTHIDAPNHFEPQQLSVDQIPPEQLFAPGVMIDVAPAVSMDPDYRLSVDDIHRFEKISGRIPDGAAVLVYTGWSRYWGNATRYANADAMGKMHFPGFSAEAIEFLVRQRDIRGVGLDTMSVDYGLSRDFAVHHALGKAGRWGLENLARLKNLPASGFYLIVAPMKIETGSGAPARVFAVVP